MTNSKRVKEQIRTFYDQRPNIQHKDQVQFVIATDVFAKRLELAQTERDKTVTIEQKDFLQIVNGNVVWGKTNNDPITAIFSSRLFQLDNFTWRGTVHHEYTHAHDFWDLADYLMITKMDDIYDYRFYNLFEWWSEYHARNAGAKNVYQHEYARNSISETISVCNNSFSLICNGLVQATSVYEVMQLFGRYSALKEMYGDMMPPLQSANKKYGLANSIIAVGDFLHSHQEFNLICDSLDELEVLMNAV